MGSYIGYVIISRPLHIRDYVIHVRPFIAFQPYFQTLLFPGHVQDSNTFMFTIFPFVVSTILLNFHFEDVHRI